MIPYIQTNTFDKVLSYNDNVKYNHLDYIGNTNQSYFYLDDTLKRNGIINILTYKAISYNNIILYLRTIKQYCYYFSHVFNINKTLLYYINEIYNFLKTAPIKCDIKLLIQINLLSLLLKGNDDENYLSHINVLSSSLNEYINNIKEKIKLK